MSRYRSKNSGWVLVSIFVLVIITAIAKSCYESGHQAELTLHTNKGITKVQEGSLWLP